MGKGSQMLEYLGVTPSAEIVYQTIIRKHEMTPSELSSATGFSDDLVHSCLHQLVNIGLASQNGNMFSAQSPEIATGFILRQQLQLLNSMETLVAQSHVNTQKFLVDHFIGKENASNTVEHIFGEDQIRAKWQEISLSANVGIDTISPESSHTQSALESSRIPTLEALQRGIKCRTIYNTSALKNAVTKEHINWLISNKVSVRTAPYLPIRMIIFDSKTAILTFFMSDALIGISVISEEGILVALASLFDLIWEKSNPLNSNRNRENVELEDDESGVLRLLMRGFTYEQIEKEMHISDRTARKIAKSLMGELGATSLFQLGALAAKEGWI